MNKLDIVIEHGAYKGDHLIIVEQGPTKRGGRIKVTVDVVDDDGVSINWGWRANVKNVETYAEKTKKFIESLMENF